MGKGNAMTITGRVLCCLVVASTLHLIADDATSQQLPARDDVQKLADRIDDLIANKWSENDIVSASPSDDSEYLRRVWLDIAGKIPTAADSQDFLDEKSNDKRQRVVDELLNGPNYVVNSANFWRAVLIPEADTDFTVRFMLPAFEGWLRQRLDENKAYDDLVSEILTMPLSGTNVLRNRNNLNPIAFYESKEIKPENLAAATSRMFLGIRIECAQCHDHPFDTWKQNDFWGYAAFFAAMQRDPQRGANGFLSQLKELFNRRTLTVPGTDEVVKATFLTGESPKIPTGTSARMMLADWMTSKENPYFARTAANRVWGHFFGIGIVDPVDDFSELNPPSHPELLDLLAAELVEHDFDMKFLVRAITASRTYQLTSSVRSEDDDTSPRLFSRMAIKGMTAEQFYNSIAQAVGTHETFEQSQRGRFRGTTTRSRFMEQFSDSNNGPTERQTSVLQALSMMNGRLVTDATALESSRTLSGIIDYPGFDNSRRIEALFLATLNRKPRPEELERFVAYVESESADKQKDDDEKSGKAISDVFWTLLNSSEFSLNH
ncbi:MAG: hypothetical protein ACI93T_001646 [Porticoccaceae bacterium]|jgi:hypothetical protein